MSIELLTALMVGAIVLAFLAGMPVAFAMGGVSMLFAAFYWGPQAFNLIATTALNSVSNFILLAVPLFIFMGMILQRSGLGEAMFRAAHILTRRVRGGLAISVIVVCSLMGAMVGIIGAGIMTAGTIALPPMLKRGYDRYLALGVVMAGGGMAILIPPSIPMILFSSVTTTSIGQMFAGGVVPALIMIALFIAYVSLRCRLRPEMAPPPGDLERVTGRDILAAGRDGMLAFVLIFMVLGSILLGIATPTEAAAVGGLGAVLLAIVYRRLSFGVVKESSINTMSMTGMIVWIVIGASVFSNFHMLMGAGRLLTAFTAESGLGPWGVILMMQLSMLILGCFIDEYIIVIICAPLYTPIAVSLGFDPVWFGVLMILNMEIAIQTPPYGFALFYLRGVAPPGVTMLDIYRSVGPFVAIKFIVLGLCMAFPELVLWLPNLLFR